MTDYEKLGAFFMGRRIDSETGDSTNESVLYKSKDLTTHAVIIGMTGSGKTGLGIGMIEEAAIDGIPVIAIDPKGDMGNLLLTFPQMRAEDFQPWVDAGAATSKGLNVEQFAADQADTWKNGLAGWGQGPARIRKMKAAADFRIYTPGSASGRPIAMLNSLVPPPEVIRDDMDLYAEHLTATTTGLLALAGIDGDPITSREHVLVSSILRHEWNNERSLDLAALLGAIQSPPLDRIGVLPLDSFYPAKDRSTLVMKLNSVLASPGFEAWLQGEPLNVQNLLTAPDGRPRVSIMSIAHLPDSQRMFFVTAMLNELIAWMRKQPGTGSLRAILYMDEVFGYMPPTANPPSKRLLLTLLKQARAFGLGVVLSTQNPVDLDYKGLSNTGTWFIGRLQTERDKERLLDGLMGASTATTLKRSEIGNMLSGLGKRRFLLHNVHREGLDTFETRWVMSYLAGPLSRKQLHSLCKDSPKDLHAASPVQVAQAQAQATAAVAAKTPVANKKPVIPADVPQYFMPTTVGAGADDTLVYFPQLLAASTVRYVHATHKVNEERDINLISEISDGPVAVDWDCAEAINIDIKRLRRKGEAGEFAACPTAAIKASNYKKWERELKSWLRNEKELNLFKSKAYKVTSKASESETEFRARLRDIAREARDTDVAKLEKKFSTRTRSLEDRLMRAQQAVERESEQKQQKKMDAAVSIGASLLGAFLGTKKVSATNARRMGSAVKSASRIRKEAGDVDRAKERVATLEGQLQDLANQFEDEAANLAEKHDVDLMDLDEIVIKPKSTGITLKLVSLAWVPYYRSSDGMVRPARA